MTFMRYVNMQIMLMMNKRHFQIGFTVMLIYSLSVYLMNVYSSIGKDVSEIYSADTLYIGNSSGEYYHYFAAAFPFMIVFPFAFSYLNDTAAKVQPFVISRMGSSYYWAKALASFIGGALLILIPFLINLILNYLTFPQNSTTYYGYYQSLQYGRELTGANVMVNTIQQGLPFLRLYIWSPLLYNLLHLMFASLSPDS